MVSCLGGDSFVAMVQAPDLVQTSERRRSERIIVMGRRNSLSDVEREHLREYNASLSGVTVHTYDWLIDLAMNLQNWAVSGARNSLSWSPNSYEGFEPPTKGPLGTV